MSKYWKARTFISRGQVSVLTASTSQLVFLVNGDKVKKTRKGWICFRKYCCSILAAKGIKCSHVMACEMWLDGDGI